MYSTFPLNVSPGSAGRLGLTRLDVRLAIAVLAMTLSSCDPDERLQACTLIGCESGLRVVLTTPPAAPYRVEAYVPGSAVRQMRQCNTGGTCDITFVDFTPAQVTIEVITTADTVRRDAAPAYQISRPNGPQCDPECRSATVTVSP